MSKGRKWTEEERLAQSEKIRRAARDRRRRNLYRNPWWMIHGDGEPRYGDLGRMSDEEWRQQPRWHVSANQYKEDGRYESVSASYLVKEQALGAFAFLCREFETARLAAFEPGKENASESMSISGAFGEHREMLCKGACICSAPVRLELSRELVVTRPGKPAYSSGRRRQSITVSTRARVLERDGFRCRRCGALPEHSRLVIDHVMPVAKGGESGLENLQTLCEPCNMGKRDRAPHDHDLRQAS